MDIISALVDLIINFIVDETVNEVTTKKKKDVRYIIFSIATFLIILALLFVCWHLFLMQQTYIGILCGVLEVMIIILWSYITIKRKRFKSMDKH